MPAPKTKTDFNKTDLGFVRDITRSIRQSGHPAASLVNRDLLILYLKIGRMIHEKIQSENRGAGVVREISADIQRRLPGIKGFSARNLYSMRTFFDVYSSLQFVQTLSAQLPESTVKSQKTSELISSITQLNKPGESVFEKAFFGIGYSLHMRILSGCKSNDERYFYITGAANNQWSFRVLDHHIDAALFRKKGRIQNNFKNTLPAKIQKTALDSFRDEYLLNFIQITEEDSEPFIEGAINTSIRDTTKPMGVATFTCTKNLPRKYRDLLPAPGELQKFLR